MQNLINKISKKENKKNAAEIIKAAYPKMSDEMIEAFIAVQFNNRRISAVK